MNNKQFPSFKIDDYAMIPQQLSQLLDHNRHLIEELLHQHDSFSWDNLMQPLEELDDQLAHFWSPISHLSSVKDCPELRSAYEQCIPLLSQYSSEMGQNNRLYQAIKSIYDSPSYAQLNTAQQKTLEHSMRDFKLAGVALSEDDQKIYQQLSQELAQLSNQFSNNVLDATQAYSQLITNKEQLAGIPEQACEMAAQAAVQKGQEGWLFTLDFPSYQAILQHADDRTLRQQFHEAFCTRASDQGPNPQQYDNSLIMIELLKARLALAQLLGFATYADLSLATKMVSTPAAVFNFLQELAEASKAKAEHEMVQLSEFSAQQLAIDQLEAWDIAYASEKMRQQDFDISEEELRPYFPINQVLPGLFTIVNKLFQLTIKPITGVESWHQDVMVYGLYDSEDCLISYVYFDLYARDHKRSGAWMDDGRIRRMNKDGSMQHPIAYVVANFSPPIGNDPSLLTHNDVVTLFHEFGHALQHMLTTIDVADVAGINGIPWDAVEIASQFLEKWSYDKESIALISKHYKTGEVLPDNLYDRMWAARNFQCGMQMMRQLEFALFDFRLHHEFDPEAQNFIEDIINDVRQQWGVVPTPSYNRFANGFAHIFAGGYAAGYYSYKWAEVMACDAFSLFEHNGIFDQATSLRFKNTFLSYGGSKEPMDVFVEFCGRKPSTDALLSQSGIVSADTNKVEDI